MKLYVPELYKALTPEGKAAICNGCGQKGWGWAVPDSIWGLCITEACNIHDFMYAVGVDEEDREEADRVFRNNMLRIIESGTKWKWLKLFRGVRALIYFCMVRLFAAPAFWNNKNKPENEMVV